jgi:hypothetical protein
MAWIGIRAYGCKKLFASMTNGAGLVDVVVVQIRQLRRRLAFFASPFELAPSWLTWFRCTLPALLEVTEQMIQYRIVRIRRDVVFLVVEIFRFRFLAHSPAPMFDVKPLHGTGHLAECGNL